MSVVELFAKGGPVMYLLLIISVAVAAIAIERFRFYNYAKSDGEGFIKGLTDRLKARNIEAALDFCRHEDNSLSKVARTGLEAAVNGDNAELALINAHDEMAMQLRARLNYLSMIVTLAPLLGLLGTISGMIDSFNVFSVRTDQPLAITGGIGEALIATATGLCVAIFALVVHTYFAQKLDEILTSLDRIVNIVLSSVGRSA